MVLRTYAYNYGLNGDGRVSESASKRLQRHCETIVQSRWLLQRVNKVYLSPSSQVEKDFSRMLY